MSVIPAVAGLALLAAACSSSASSQPPPAPHLSSAGAQQCSVHYAGHGTSTTLTITSTLAGKLDITSAAVGSADEQTKTLGTPGTATVDVQGNPLISLRVTLTAGAAPAYVCSVAPA